MKGRVLIPFYSLLGLALVACWQLRSPPSIVGVSVLLTGVTVFLTVDFSRAKLSGAGVSVEIERELARVEDAAAEVVATTRLTPEQVHASAAEDQRRGAIERLISEASDMGWRVARRGWPEPPHPSVIWTPDGKPAISLDSPHPLSDRHLDAIVRRIATAREERNG